MNDGLQVWVNKICQLIDIYILQFKIDPENLKIYYLCYVRKPQ